MQSDAKWIWGVSLWHVHVIRLCDRTLFKCRKCSPAQRPHHARIILWSCPNRYSWKINVDNVTAGAGLFWRGGKMLQQVLNFAKSRFAFQTVGSHDFGKILTTCCQFCLPGKIIRSPQCVRVAGLKSVAKLRFLCWSGSKITCRGCKGLGVSYSSRNVHHPMSCCGCAGWVSHRSSNET